MSNSSNELVEDPLAVEREGAMINRWTLEEGNIFSEKLAAFEKDFKKIASFLDHKQLLTVLNSTTKIIRPIV